ncbi:LacI family transcriptional regulator [Ruania suaedae]|uniref:LacI family DNA-binding transcriptional regulator n=1 Tax=Ruania suaedae TaxID=2897774 RepID=UPI001E5CD0C9|nr:LacI family DNA-binding transcriptional regulator [Ruania suaedae]UFU02866.1 LacI family transcriptional regulator [Ruania suaedae]
MSRVGIRDVALHADVATGTVSNYLNHPERVSPETARRIAAAIEILGFVPSQAGRQLRSGTSRLIGYLAPDISNPYFTEIAESVERGAATRNVSVLFADSHRSRAREDAYLSVFEEHRVLGLFVSSHEPIEDRLAQVRRRGTPSVLVGQQALHPDQPSVSVDDVSGGRQAAAHLIDRRRRRLAFVGGPLTIAQVASRLTGASAAVSGGGAGLEIIDTADRTVEAGRRVGAQLLDRAAGARPDGILAVNDLVALGLMQTLVHGGVRVPEDVAIVGYDDNEFAEASLIPLTSVRGRHEEFGRSMIDLLFEAIAGEFSGQVHRTFEPTLVVRASTAAGAGTSGRSGD